MAEEVRRKESEADRKELDALWHQALCEAIKDGEQFTRYHFAALVAAAEREACARLCMETEPFYGQMFADAIRAKGVE
jgi:hypothetical protein